MSGPKIELQKSPHAFRVITVDGIRWGAVKARAAGMHGVFYHFEDAAGDIVPKTKGQPVKHYSRSDHFSGNASVPSDKKFLSDLGIRGRGGYAIKEAKSRGVYVALDDRLIAEITKAIREKRLIGPDEIKEQARKESEAHEKRVTAAQEKEDAEFEQKARDTINNLGGWNCPGISDEDVQTVVEALRWAQSR